MVNPDDDQSNLDSIAKLREKVESLQAQLAERGENAAGNASNNIRIDASRAPKIPPIARTNLRNWLFQVEATLRRANITQDSTKFDYLVCALDDDAMSNLSHIIQCSPLPHDAFEQAKLSLISAYALTNEENLRKLLKGQIANTNCKPSLILSQIRELNATCKLPEEVLKSIFLEQLTDHQREILTLLSDKDLKTLAETADKLYTANSISLNQQYVHSVAASNQESRQASSDSSVVAAIGDLGNKIDCLINVLKKSHISQSSQNSQTPRDKSHSRDRSKSREPKNLCRAHTKYPDNPTNCKKWCSKFTEWCTENNKTPK